jgi:hypothetical protein
MTTNNDIGHGHEHLGQEMIQDSLACSIPPVYPRDEQDVEEDIQRQVDERLQELLNRLVIYLAPSKDVWMTLIAMHYASGGSVTHIMGVENTETAIAKAFGLTKQRFSKLVKTVRRDFNMPHSSNTHLGRSQEAYSNNYIQPKKD